MVAAPTLNDIQGDGLLQDFLQREGELALDHSGETGQAGSDGDCLNFEFGRLRASQWRRIRVVANALAALRTRRGGESGALGTPA